MGIKVAQNVMTLIISQLNKIVFTHPIISCKIV